MLLENVLVPVAPIRPIRASLPASKFLPFALYVSANEQAVVKSVLVHLGTVLAPTVPTSRPIRANPPALVVKSARVSPENVLVTLAPTRLHPSPPSRELSLFLFTWDHG